MLNVKPLSDRVLVRVEEEKAEQGGIYIPEVAREKQCYAHVVKVGTGKADNKGWQFFVEEGQTVLFTRYAGTVVDLGIPDAKFLLLRQDDILGVVNSDVEPEG